MRYIVHAVCTGTIRERWIVSADRSLTDEEITDALSGGAETPDGITIDCTDEETDEETGRVVVSIQED
jgi:hypothetical protein